jgi:cyclophilin family peptidyl-prolyl cis-trans isomerase
VAASLTDVDVLRKLVQDASPMVRSGAAQALSEVGARVPLDDLLAMLNSEDLVVRQVAIELLGKKEDEKGAIPQPIVLPVLRQLRVDPDPDVMSLGFELLASRAARRPKDFDPKDSLLRDTLVRGIGHPDAYVRDPARRLSATLGIDLGEVPRRDDVALPTAAEAAQIASARVFTTRGEFRIELEPEVAPLAVVNFARLAEGNFYDGVVWHRVVPGFVVQTGDPRGDGSGGPGWTLPDEVSALPYDEGAVGMARSGPDTGGSQWFVTIEPQPHLVGDYTRFGRITAGMHVVKSLERGDRILDVVVERVPTDG